MEIYQCSNSKHVLQPLKSVKTKTTFMQLNHIIYNKKHHLKGLSKRGQVTLD